MVSPIFVVKRSLALLAFLSPAVVNASAAASVYDGSDGAFAPTASMRLIPDTDNIFSFTSFDIPDGVVVSVDRAGRLEPLSIYVQGDVAIHGAFDVGRGGLSFNSLGTVTIAGKVYGDPFTVSGTEFHWVNNPNGRPDGHWYGSFSTTIFPDGLFPAVTPIEGLVAGSLEYGFEFSVDANQFLPWGGLADSNYALAPVPLPGTMVLLGSACLGLAGVRRRRKMV